MSRLRITRWREKSRKQLFDDEQERYKQECRDYTRRLEKEMQEDEELKR